LQFSRSTTTGVNPERGSMSALKWMQFLGQASMQRPHALQNCGNRNGFGLALVSVRTGPICVVRSLVARHLNRRLW
jgi:hypothetical protein